MTESNALLSEAHLPSKMEKRHSLLILLLALVSGGWAIIIAGYYQTDEK